MTHGSPPLCSYCILFRLMRTIKGNTTRASLQLSPKNFIVSFNACNGFYSHVIYFHEDHHKWVMICSFDKLIIFYFQSFPSFVFSSFCFSLYPYRQMCLFVFVSRILHIILSVYNISLKKSN